MEHAVVDHLKFIGRLSVVMLTAICSLTASAALGLTPGSVPTKDLQSIQRIAVMSVLGDRFHGIRVNRFDTNVQNYSADVAAWKIDSFVQREIEQLMSQRGRLPMDAIPLDATAVEALYDAPYEDHLDVEKVLEVTKSFGVDTLLLVKRTRSAIRPLDHHRGGFGMISRPAMAKGTLGCVYVYVVISVYDVASGRDLAERLPLPCVYGTPIVEPRDRFEDFSEGDQRQLQVAVKLELSRTLDTELTKMGLIGRAGN
jgi:hypothetical protein